MSISLKFFGAAGTVTGSCFMLTAGGSKFLVDCGLFQGSKTEKQLNYDPFPFAPDEIDAVLLTHAHIDHAGLLPKLTRGGFRGPIHATAPTVDLCSVMLPDSASIQEMEVKYLNRRNRQRGRPEVTPIYVGADAEQCIEQFSPAEYESWIDVADGVRARFWNAGHLIGSASIEIEVADDGEGARKTFLFSGDVGPDCKLLHPDPEAPSGFDYVVCESTYGGRDRTDRSPEHRRQTLADEVNAAVERGGPLLVPSFAVERTQELVTDLVGLMHRGDIPEAQIFIDSPLATKASKVFVSHAHELELGDELLRAFQSKLLKFTESARDSKSINRLRGFFIVIAASGMCDAGRIRHHLKHRLWRSDTTVLMAGYQAKGTLGRLLLEGKRRVRIQGDEVAVKASIRALDNYSGHADGPELVTWLEERKPVRQNIFLVHGEGPSRIALRDRIADKVVAHERVLMPMIDDGYELGRDGAQVIDSDAPHRLEPDAAAHEDWNNQLTQLIMDINEAVRGTAGGKARRRIIGRLRRALTGE